MERYEFPVSRLPEAIQRPVKLFWRPDRTIGKRHSGIQFYFWHESRVFSEVDEIAAVLKIHAKQGDLIFGDSTSTPLIALLSNLPIALNFVDTNTMRFKAGLPPVDEAIANLEDAILSTDQRLEWIVINYGRGIGGIDAFRRFFQANFYPFKTFQTRRFDTYILMKRMHPLPSISANLKSHSPIARFEEGRDKPRPYNPSQSLS